MDLRHIQAFVAAYEEGSINRAAQRLGTPQSSASVLIRDLETELGAQLLQRLARGIAPTPVGDTFYRHCQRVLATVDAARHAVKADADAIAGSINAGLAPTIAKGVLPNVLRVYAEQYPQVDIRVAEAFSGTLVEWTIAGDVDFAVVAVAATDRRLAIQPLTSEPIVLVASAQSGHRHLEPLSLRNGAAQKLVLPSARHSLRHLLDQHIRNGGISVNRTIEIDGLFGILEFVRKSDWVTLLPISAVASELDGGSFAIRPIADPFPPLEFYLVHPAHRALSPAARLFVEKLTAGLVASLTAWNDAISKATLL